MKNLYTTFLLSFLFFAQLHAQETVVQSLTYDSTSRSMMVEFPEGDHNQYEKILMYYSMRCKDGLVSTGAERNKGCGEWDYSCNTLITDSTRIDSTIVMAPSHVIDGFTENTFDYASDPTYSYYQSTLKNVNYNGVNSETDFVLDAGSDIITVPLGGDISERKSQFLYKKSDIQNSGLTAGIISGLRLPIAAGSGDYPRLRVRMTQTDLVDLDGATIHDENLMEVFYDNVAIASNELFIKFYQNFSWDGNSNIIIEVSYSGGTNDLLALEGGTTDYAASFSCDGDENRAFYSEGGAAVKVDHDINFSGDEVTIALWYFGSNSQPINSTLFEAVDADNNRQLNVHLPWGDANVYWDCGNDGSGYDRISKATSEYDEIKKWNHWAFTKNATTGYMRIFLNGEPFAIGLNKRKAITFNTLRVGGATGDTRRSFGSFDDFKIFDKELTAEEVKSIMSRQIEPGQDLYDNMVVNYDFNQLGQGAIVDHSQNAFHGTLIGNADARKTLGRFLLNEAQLSQVLPDITFVRGSYNRTIDEVMAVDSIPNSPYFITEYEVVNNVLQIKDEFSYYLSGFVPIYDETGELIDARFVDPDGTITITDLSYFRERPARYEIMSFVTPYGIGIDFGLAGKTWVFDVTDFGPILKGDKRLTMERGGQFQEEMDIKFVFIEGVPTRNVIDIQQIWAASAESYNNIINNTRFEPRTIRLNPLASDYTLTAAVTGHGQEGEFIPQTHYLNVNGGARELEWQVWKECADNPIYPQGGTWIYDRAGWCPGAPTDVRRLDLNNVNPGENVTIDYGVNTASGDSRYIVNVQLISYGAANFSLDAELVDVINPSARPEYERFNPMCGSPRIKIRNTGSTNLTSVRIVYGVEGRRVRTYNWTGNLKFMEEEVVELFPLKLDINATGQEFYARIENPNGGTDEYGNNNEKKTIIPVMGVQAKNIVVEMQTNGRANETSWKLFDENGNVMASRGGGLNANTLYRDTVSALAGCYELFVEDSDQDGISWWANNDGNGYVRIRDIGGNNTTLEVDFGAYERYEFVTEGYLPTITPDSDLNVMSIYPNPGLNEFTIVFPEINQKERLIIYNHQGKEVMVLEANELRQEEIQISLSKNSPGLYFAELTTADNVLNISFVKM